MIEQDTIFKGLKQLISRKKIVSISGCSGTGKTTLALQLVGNFLTQNKPYNDSCIWIQASEHFPKRRFNKIFTSLPEKSYYLKENIFITPRKSICETYYKQAKIIKNIINDGNYIPPNLKYIVIDNISHHLRYEISKFDDIKSIISILNEFFNSNLLPLILFCQRESIILILIHEVSFDINSAKNKPFYNKLYNRIDSLIITLTKNFAIQDNAINVFFNGNKWVLKYRIEDKGIIWLNKL